MLNIVFICIAYLCGSVNFAITLCKLNHLPDPRLQGSGNPGATNVLRFAGKKLAFFVILGDILKGVVPVLLARMLNVHDLALSFVAFAAVLGHMYPIFFRFQGGKGVATMLGAVTALSWLVGLAMIVTWAIVALIFRFSSLASLVAVILLPLYLCLWSDHYYLGPMILMALVIIYRHHMNIKRLLKGQEPKIGAREESTLR